MEGFASAQKGTNTIRKKCPRKTENSSGAEQQKYPMTEYYIGPFIIPFSHMDGTNRHAAHTDKQIKRVNHQNKRVDQINCAKSVRSHAPAYKNRINNREQDKTEVA